MGINFSFHWETTPEEAFSALLENYLEWLYDEGHEVMADNADAMVTFAKANAPWQDVTGRARSELYAVLQGYRPRNSEALLADLILSHGVDYGAVLELGRAGRFAIIMPTIDNYGPKVMADLQAMLDSVR